MKPQFPGNIPRIKISSEENEVCVDMDNHCFMVTLENYRVTTRQSVWKKLIELADEFKKRNLRYCYFSSTPQGGGGYVAKPMPEVFVITKRKFHNVLQGVAPNTDESRLTDEDKDLWVRWCNDNFDRYWGENTGVVQKADVIIIDDPQLCAIIPSIKRVNPKCRIIYRSHIEIRADLIAQEGSLQKEVWDFLFSFISKADMFISHPISGFIPPYIPLSKVGLMPAATDQLDGLNKFLDEPDVQYYRNVFNRYCEDQCSPQLKPKRSYFIQVSRFDPSKGIPDVLEAYRIFKSKCLEMRVQEINIPQLVICGNGSIDDPDGNVVYDEAVSILCSPGYEIVREDVCLVRVPHCDQVLNSILRGAIVALQLSHREGFEVKVTEALAKQVPVIAYRTGGIPLQLENDISGYLVEPGNVKKVADLLYELFSDVTLHRKIAGKLRGEEQVLRRQEYYTTFQSTNWLYLVNCLAYKGGSVKPEDLPLKAPDEGTYDCNGKIIDWGAKYVKDFWAK
ncbi:hypothetical protein H4219_004344 [Mycoemilia scoparia]|uniref:Glycosyl transferase family 1 domain-containing protein n=1 Tax=Mycoemilia scoparia TaxID=417184 RepID=A0A9W8DLM5_9FUNG|nr:hypothetical protein H4219_004344 [Mycoemilia scoparia]